MTKYIEKYNKIYNQVETYNSEMRNLHRINSKINLINSVNYLSSLKIYQMIIMKYISRNNLRIQIQSLSKIYEILFNISIITLNYLHIFMKKSQKEIMDENRDLFIRKNKDYGNSFEDFSLIGIIVRLNDKINRLLCLHEDAKDIQVNEKIEDTLNDLYNYCILGLIYKE